MRFGGATLTEEAARDLDARVREIRLLDPKKRPVGRAAPRPSSGDEARPG